MNKVGVGAAVAAGTGVRGFPRAVADLAAPARRSAGAARRAPIALTYDDGPNPKHTPS